MNKLFLRSLTLLVLATVSSATYALSETDYTEIKDIPYYSEVKTADPYQKERCKLDLYYPENRSGFATIIWFHGGGLTSGDKSIPELLKRQDLAVVSPSYRFSGDRARCPDYIEDAAAATAWVLNHIAEYGGDNKKVFLCGSSAGGYLSAMIGFDPIWLRKFGCSNRQLAAIIPMSAQMTTHFQIKKERSIREAQTVVDEYAPISHISGELPPILLVTGDPEMDWPARVEENHLLSALLRRVAHHPDVRIYEQQGCDHGMACEAFPVVIKYVRTKLSELQAEPKKEEIVSPNAVR